MRYYIYPILLLSIFLIVISCDDDNPVDSRIDLLDDTYNNIPVIVNTKDSYTFTISANNFSYSEIANINFSSDSIVVSITLVNASSSNSSMRIIDLTETEMFSETLNENKVLVDTEFDKIPNKIMIELNNFTGQLTIVIGLKEI